MIISRVISVVDVLFSLSTVCAAWLFPRHFQPILDMMLFLSPSMIVKSCSNSSFLSILYSTLLSVFSHHFKSCLFLDFMCDVIIMFSLETNLFEHFKMEQQESRALEILITKITHILIHQWMRRAKKEEKATKRGRGTWWGSKCWFIHSLPEEYVMMKREMIIL